MSKRTIIVLIAILIILIAGAITAENLSKKPIPPAQMVNSQEVEQVLSFVTDFGTKLKIVSLTAPKAQVAEAMNANYASYVSPDLLTAWEQDPSSAPGRLSSSPWPDHINVFSIKQDPASTTTSYIVQGSIIELTSQETTHGGIADELPFLLTVEVTNGKLAITEFVKGEPTAPPAVSATTTSAK